MIPIFNLFEAWPRFKDLVVDPMKSEPSARGALVLRGPLKMLQTVAMVTQRGKATTTAERFRPLVSRCCWYASDVLDKALEGADGQEGLTTPTSLLDRLAPSTIASTRKAVAQNP